jgi:replicative DNA helicase
MERVYQSAELMVAKQRHGATGEVKMRFDSRISKCCDPVDEGYLPEMRS